ncbi:PAS domain S-box protein [Sulfurimonas sp. HSL-1656]|uniref:PAS domain S-box protein n=1 Tax=Thiomicrolovo subterrani TaxID=3131934 RepID=UPI0031F92F59
MGPSTTEQIQRALNEWLSALDVLKEPIFLHDSDFRVIRCNKAYSVLANLPYEKIIGSYYYDVFPKLDGPLPNCKGAIEEHVTYSVHDEITIDGRIYYSRSSVVNDANGNYRYSIHILEDITERRSAEIKLCSEKHFSDKLVESLPGIFFLLDAKGCLLRWNGRLEEIFGLDHETLKGYDALTLVHPDDQAYINQRIGETFTKGATTSEARLLTQNGAKYYALTGQRIASPEGDVLIGVGIDMTEHRRIEQEVRRERDFNRKLVDTAQVIILVLDTRGCILRFNRYMELLSGYSLDEVKGKDWFETFLPAPSREVTKERFLEAINDLDSNGQLDSIVTRQGRTLQIEWYSKTLRDGEGNAEGLLAIGMDVTKKRETEKRLELFHSLFDQSMDAVHIVDPVTMCFIDVNETACRDLGYTREEMLQMSVYDIDPTVTDEKIKMVNANMNQEDNIRFESLNRRKDGTTFPVEISASLITVDKPYFLSIVRNTSERVASREALNRANRALRTLSEGNLVLIHAPDEETLLHNATNVIVEHGGYSLAVVDFVGESGTKSLNPIAWAGLNVPVYWIGELSWDNSTHGDFPAGHAVKQKTTQICRDIASEYADTPWGEAAVSHGYNANISMPLLQNGNVFGVLSIYSNVPEPFDKDEVELLEELAEDLAYGILNLRTRASHERHETLLRESLEQSIQAIAATVESRDPYTAGHQKRVAELATAIGREMGLDDDRVQGIGFAGIIHDLGKVHIPAEILSKPGRLSAIEYQLIQTHPEAGYDIVKDVRFPWPIAQIILQHHERVDGSGYPHGLKGEAILLEAKIIAIADTVDAISSHRPYRSARGIDTALREIQNGKGSAFDPDAVDACVRLFTEKGFEFSTESPLITLN